MNKLISLISLRKLLPLTLSILAATATAKAIAAAPSPALNAATLNAENSSAQPAKNQPAPVLEAATIQSMQLPDLSLPIWIYPVGGFILLLIFLPKIGWIAGLIVIGEREVGIVTKKFSSRSLPPNRLIALNGEAGLQADTLPPGWHFGYFPWQYSVNHEAVTIVPQGEIGLVVANDGATLPPDRILGKATGSDSFQDARKFFTDGGQKGRQLDIITAGTYRINTSLFNVITAATAAKHGMTAAQLQVHTIAPDGVGIVTTLDGTPIDTGEIAGPTIPDHDNFQRADRFVHDGGRRGLQEQVILSGSWNLNPWFVQTQQVPMTQVPIGYVGVVISFVGQSHQDVSGDAFTHGNLVNKGDKGVWVEPLYPGKHPLNTQIMKVELVPTTNIVLNFTSRFSGEHGYDSNLTALKLLSFDGFEFDLEVFQIIHVGALDAPKVISRLGSMQNLVDHVLRPIVGNYFRNSAQEFTILDFLSARSERQAEAAEYVRQALRAYDVQAVDTLIGLITPPPELMHTLTDRKIAEEQQKTYEVQRVAQTQRQELVRETALADIQGDIITAQEGVTIAELQAAATVKQANGEAEAIRVTGQAKADAYQAGVNSLGSQAYTALQLMQVIGDRKVRVVPDVSVSSSGGSGLLDGLMGMMVWNQSNGNGSLLGKAASQGDPAAAKGTDPAAHPTLPETIAIDPIGHDSSKR